MSCISEAETNQNNKCSTIPFFSLVNIEKPNFSSVLFQIEIFFFIFYFFSFSNVDLRLNQLV